MPSGRKKSIVVTGGTGYIGSHTAVELIEKGHEVILLDDLSNSHIEVLGAIRKITGVTPDFHRIDLCDKEALLVFFQSRRVDAVIHFAAYKWVGESVEDPLLYYSNNVNSLVSLLSCMEQSGVKQLVFSSSCSVYGEPDRLPVSEEAPFKAASPYARTKQVCEYIIEDVTRVKNIRAVSLRYFNPIGSHDSALLGELSKGWPNNLVPIITQVAIGKRPRLFVFGNDYNTPDGTCIRDYIHVTDVAAAHVKAIEWLERSEVPARAFNLGTGRGHSVLEIIRTFEEATGKKVPFTMAPRRPGDVEQVYADTTMANKDLGWKTDRTLQEALSSAWKWEEQMALMNQEK